MYIYKLKIDGTVEDRILSVCHYTSPQFPISPNFGSSFTSCRKRSGHWPPLLSAETKLRTCGSAWRNCLLFSGLEGEMTTKKMNCTRGYLDLDLIRILYIPLYTAISHFIAFILCSVGSLTRIVIFLRTVNNVGSHGGRWNEQDKVCAFSTSTTTLFAITGFKRPSLAQILEQYKQTMDDI